MDKFNLTSFTKALVLLLLIFLTTFPVMAITVSGKIVIPPQILANMTEARFNVVFYASSQIRYETEVLVSSDLNSGHFSFNVGDMTEKVFIISAKCQSGCNDSRLSRAENYYSEFGPTDIYRLATFFKQQESDVSDLRFEVGTLDTVSGNAFLPRFNKQSSLRVTLGHVFNVPIQEPLYSLEPRSSYLYFSPQTNIFFRPQETKQSYSLGFIKDSRVSHTISVFYDDDSNTATHFTAVSEGQLLPNSSTDDPSENINFPGVLIFNAANGKRKLDLYPFALNGKISIAGKVNINTSEISNKDRFLLVEVVSKANLNKSISSTKVLLRKNTSSVNFTLKDVLGDPSGANLKIRVSCVFCENKKSLIDKNFSLSPRRSHSGVQVNYTFARQKAVLPPLLLLLDDES